MQIMEFPDFPANTAGESYLHHSQVLQYLHDYADHFALRPFISFSHQLLKVARNQSDNVWEVTVNQQLPKPISFTRHFDILLLCPGRYSRPKWPADLIETLSNFTGSVVHSHSYRSREAYAGQRVAVIGGGPSGLDISLEVSTVAREVLFIHRNAAERVFHRLPANVRQIRGDVKRFTANTVEVVVLPDETTLSCPIDAVIFATGYQLSLDFLDQPSSCGLRLNTESDSIDGLYRHLVNVAHPSMAILAVAVGAVLPFPLYHQQVRYFRALQLGVFELPAAAKITENEEMKVQTPEKRNCPNRHLLADAESLRRYIRSLEAEAKLDRPLKPVLLTLFSDLLHRIQLENSGGYREQRVVLINDEQYELY